MNKEIEEITIHGQDGQELNIRIWHVPEPRAVLCLIHGLGDHISRYEELADELNKANIAVVGQDIRGHGKSGGKRGHIHSLSYVLDDMEELLKSARSDYTDVPMFLYGHSMGGNLVLNFCMNRNTNELQGLIVSSPWIKLAFEPSKSKIKLARFVSSFFPALTQGNDLDVSALSRDEKVISDYSNDPLVHEKISAKTFLEIVESSDFIISNPGKLKIDSLLYHGSADKITSFEATKSFASESGKIFYEFSGTYHEPHNDLDKKDVYKLLINFITKRT